ncbi:MAG TPA: hypothetical protein VJA21_18070 [Verrucomicrobiae bacterium]
MNGLRITAQCLGIGSLLTINPGCSCTSRPASDPEERSGPVPGSQRVHLVDADQVEMGGVWGSAYNQGLARLNRDPFSVTFLLADVNFGMKRWFTNYSGDISGRFLEVASVTSARGIPRLPAVREVIDQIGRYQRADGHFGAEVVWSAPIDFSTSSDQTTVMPILWGNGRLLLGLVAAHERFGGVVIRYGPHVLMNTVDGEKKRLGLRMVDGRLQLPGREAPSTLAPWGERNIPPGITALCSRSRLTEPKAEHDAQSVSRYWTRSSTSCWVSFEVWP